ncbi:hypothetical protein R3P38DRAFT_2782438 [Favolaschia claudopus]|uniref:Uncharacterized protein n=1 Tax=Favolaschia claudopus TaxID=2862362 RepID=A0AAW0B235_9AGAR
MALPRRTRSGAEYSPFSDAVALQLPHIRLRDLLARREDGPDSDAESDAESDSETSDDEEATPATAPRPRPQPPTFLRPTPSAPPPPGGPMPGSIIRCARPSASRTSLPAKPSTPAPNGPMPGSIIRCARPQPAPPRPWGKLVGRVKKHAKQRAARREERERRCIQAGTRLKHIASVRVRRADPLYLNLGLGDIFHAPVASSGWQAVRQTEENPRAYTLKELMEAEPDMQVYDWQGEPTPVVDADNLILFCLGGFPDDQPGRCWDEEVAQPAAQGFRAAAIDIYTEPRWLRKRRARSGESVPRRGPHAAKSFGISMGGGQTHPQNLAHSLRLQLIMTHLLALSSIQRIAGWTNMLFMAFAKQLHSFYEKELCSVCRHDPRATRNFPARLSVFSTATFNFGPATVTFPHIDYRNLAWGWCAITALGNFNPDLGGHLVLWDLKLIIRFPPGSTILIPSAILRHSNTKIQANETRFSFTQFTPAGLFRWVYNKFRTDADIDKSKSTTPAEHEQRRRDRARRWAEGVKMYTTWKGRVSTM